MKQKRVVLIIVIGFLMISSLIGALVLVRESQETRRRAAEEEEEMVIPTATPAEESDLDCNFTCTDLYAIDADGNKIDDQELQDLTPQEICFEIESWTNCEQEIDRAQFRIIGWEDWELGDYHRDQPGVDDYGRYYYYRWCHDFDEVVETSCRDIDAQVCIGEVCR